MGDPETKILSASFGESCIAFVEEVMKRAFAGGWFRIPSITCLESDPIGTALQAGAIASLSAFPLPKLSESVGKTVKNRTGEAGGKAVDPLSDEVDTDLVAPPHISPKIDEVVVAERAEEGSGPAPGTIQLQPFLAEKYQGDERFSVEEIQREGHQPLNIPGENRVVNHQEIFPIGFQPIGDERVE